MQFRRQAASSSPLRELYGAANGRLILPMDLCLVIDGPNGEAPQFPTAPGVFNGDAVVDTGGGTIGTIASYDWPPATAFDVKPLARVAPAAAVAVPSGQAPKPNVRTNDVVELETIDGSLQSVRSGVLGTVSGLDVLRAWPDLARRVHTYRVDFGQHLFPTSHGARVVLQNGGALLGMLLFTQNQPDGTCDAFVYPAHLV